ncbi:MAG: FHA domain-containing protein, partial [Actinobacteria bacterium]
AELRAVSGAVSGRSWRLPAGEVKIGRDATNLVAVEDAKASREHARIRYADGVYTLSDLGSSNGTFVNERQISGQVPLSDGDMIRIGNTTLSFKA